MRLFIGINIPNKIKRRITKEISFLKTRYPTFRWVEEKNYHITLLFLGEVKKEKLPKIVKRLEKSIFDISPFYLFSYSFNLFINHKIIIYINFKREKILEILAKNIKDEFREFCFKTNTKKFVPHLTVARARIPSKQQYFVLKKLLGKQKTDFYFKIEKITLFQSVLTPKGPIYKKLKEIPLIEVKE